MNNVNLSKQLIKAKLRDMGLGHLRVTAKTVSFEDLARASRIIVTIWDWDGTLDQSERILEKNGTSARIEFRNPKTNTR